jgi:hypothetical protein
MINCNVTEDGRKAAVYNTEKTVEPADVMLDEDFSDFEEGYILDDVDSFGKNGPDLTDELSSESSTGLVNGSAEEMEEIAAIMQEMESLRETLHSQPDIQPDFEDEDLSKYYFSDEEEESSSEMYTEWDAMEYKTVTFTDRSSANKENKSRESDDAIQRELERLAREQRLAYEHDQFDLDSVKAMWLDGVDRNQKLPGFTLLVTSNEDPYFIKRLCCA